MDVYDAAAWSAPAALSEKSVAGGNVPVEFPDFTRGGGATGAPERPDNLVAASALGNVRVGPCRPREPGPGGPNPLS